MEIVITEILHKMMDNLSTEQLKQLQTSLYMVLGKYEIVQKSTELRCIDSSWQIDLERFLERKRIAGKSERTIAQYQYHMSRVLAYINKPIKDITEGDLNMYLEFYRKYKQVGSVYLDGIRLCMSSFFGWQHKKGFIPKNPAAGVDPIKREKKVKKAYSDEELEKIRRTCTRIRDLAIVEFLYATGVRISEMTALNREDIRFHEKELIVYGKGAKEREVYLTPISSMYLTAYLCQRKDDNPALFVAEKKPYNRLTPAGVEQLLRSIGRKAGVEKVHPHRFRRTMATNLLSKGMPIEEVREILGHVKLETTLLYTTINKVNVKSDFRRFMAA